MGKLVYLENIVTLELDREKCIGCGMCGIVCPRAVYAFSGKKADIVDKDSCIECGACARNCPAGAIHVRAGVGCATAVLNSMLGFKTSSCDCTLDQYETAAPKKKASGTGRGCC
ncbi:MAG: mercury methylation ferredoxin HgcB [Syntrophobacteraceae bacterium]